MPWKLEIEYFLQMIYSLISLGTSYLQCSEVKPETYFFSAMLSPMGIHLYSKMKVLMNVSNILLYTWTIDIPLPTGGKHINLHTPLSYLTWQDKLIPVSQLLGLLPNIDTKYNNSEVLAGEMIHLGCFK